MLGSIVKRWDKKNGSKQPKERLYIQELDFGTKSPNDPPSHLVPLVILLSSVVEVVGILSRSPETRSVTSPPSLLREFSPQMFIYLEGNTGTSAVAELLTLTGSGLGGLVLRCSLRNNFESYPNLRGHRIPLG